MKRLPIILLLIGLLAGGCVFAYRQSRLRSVPAAAWTCLRQPRQMTVYSTIPDPADPALAGARFFHGYRILGEVSVSAATDQQRVAETIKDAVLHFPDPSICFNPRHGIRVTDGHSAYDFVICFECGLMDFYVGDQHVGGTEIGGPPDVLNSILTAAGVPLAATHEH